MSEIYYQIFKSKRFNSFVPKANVKNAKYEQIYIVHFVHILRLTMKLYDFNVLNKFVSSFIYYIYCNHVYKLLCNEMDIRAAVMKKYTELLEFLHIFIKSE